MSQLTACQNVSSEEKELIYIKVHTINYNLPRRIIVVKTIIFFFLYHTRITCTNLVNRTKMFKLLKKKKKGEDVQNVLKKILGFT